MRTWISWFPPWSFQLALSVPTPMNTTSYFGITPHKCNCRHCHKAGVKSRYAVAVYSKPQDLILWFQKPIYSFVHYLKSKAVHRLYSGAAKDWSYSLGWGLVCSKDLLSNSLFAENQQSRVRKYIIISCIDAFLEGNSSVVWAWNLGSSRECCSIYENADLTLVVFDDGWGGQQLMLGRQQSGHREAVRSHTRAKWIDPSEILA